MMTHISRAVLAVGVVTMVFLSAGREAPAGETLPKPSKKPDAAAEAMRLLGVIANGDFDARRAAEEKLAKLGDAARSALERAARSNDAEAASVARRLLRDLEKAAVVLVCRDEVNRPVADMEVALEVFGGEGDIHRRLLQGNFPAKAAKENLVRTNAAGEIRREIKPGTFSTAIEVKGRVSAPSLTSLPPQPSPAGRLNAGETARILLRLSRTATLSGAVKKAGTDEPAAETTLWLLSETENTQTLCSLLFNAQMGNANLPSTSADKQGRYAFENVTPGVYRVLSAAPNYEMDWTEPVVARAGANAEAATLHLVVKSEKTGTLTVPCMDAAGRPWAKKTVRITATARPLFSGRRAAELRRLWNGARCRQMGGRQQQAENRDIETDEQGLAVLKDLRPGSYDLFLAPMEKDQNGKVVQGNLPLRELNEAVLAPEQNATTPTVKFQPGGRIVGRVTGLEKNENGRVQLCAVSEEEARNTPPALWPNLVWQRQALFNNQFSGSHQTQQAKDDDTYEIPNLSAGRWVVAARLPRNQAAMIWGVEITEDGKKVNTPDIVVPPPEKGTGVMQVKGQVILPAKVDLRQVLISLSGFQGSTSTNVQKDGSFLINSSGAAYQWLHVNVPGCVPVRVDLGTPDVDPLQLTVKPTALAYGEARLTLTDEAGRPVGGVRVVPVTHPSQPQYGRHVLNGSFHVKGHVVSPHLTGADGTVLIRGLQTGLREFLVAHDHFYVPGPVALRIALDKTARATVRLKTKPTLRGRIDLPPDADPSGVAVCVTAVEGRFYPPVDRDGRFELKFLTPGKNYCRVIAAGWAAAKQETVLLKEGDAEAALRLVPRCGLALRLPAPAPAEENNEETNDDDAGEYAFGASRLKLQLRLAGEENPEYVPCLTFYEGTGQARVLRAEFTDLPPGEYDLLLTPHDVANHGMTTAPVAQIVKGLKAEPLPLKENATEALKAVPVSPAAAAGTVVLRPQWHGPKFAGQMHGRVQLRWRLRAAFGEAGVQQHNAIFDPLAGRAQRVLHFGKPPTGIVTTPDGQSVAVGFVHAPPGAYRLSWSLKFPGSEDHEDAEEHLVREVAVEAGKTTELGDVEMRPTPAETAAMEQAFEAARRQQWGQDAAFADRVELWP